MFYAWFFLSILVSYLGESRKIGAVWAFVLSILLSPVIGGIITLASRSKHGDSILAEQKKQTQAILDARQPTIADELAGLSTMFDARAITMDEYLAARRKVLSMPEPL